jgi:chemotaxis protein methyltransferase CheR
MTLAGDDFAFMARLLRRRGGLVLGPDKAILLDLRLKPVIRRFGLSDLPSLVRQLRLGQEALAAAVTEAMTVNETSFFRDSGQFDILRDQVLPRLLAARGADKRLRIWSAAAAAGQEAYSIDMLLDEMEIAGQGWTIDLVATDISGETLSRAQKGEYSAFEIQRGLSPERLTRHFSKTPEGAFTIAETLRRTVTFRRFNLLDSFGWLDDLDIVLCRNVLIYFDGPTRASILERMADSLNEGGVLLLGETETSISATPAFAPWPGAGGFHAKAKAPRLSVAV